MCVTRIIGKFHGWELSGKGYVRVGNFLDWALPGGGNRTVAGKVGVGNFRDRKKPGWETSEVSKVASGKCPSHIHYSPSLPASGVLLIL